jgi:hypothetical protein
LIQTSLWIAVEKHKQTFVSWACEQQLIIAISTGISTGYLLKDKAYKICLIPGVGPVK